MSGEKLLLGSGKVSHPKAMTKVKKEYQKYQAKTLSGVESAYLNSLKEFTAKTTPKKNASK
jgi:hypothetical protein